MGAYSLRLLYRCVVFLFWIMGAVAHSDDSIPITILHTNDLHSRFRSEKNLPKLGGIARLKTAIDRIRKSVPNTLLLDGGDWSEGTIYYTENTGAESVRMLDRLGYDAAVVGNHDWLNGPDVLLNSLVSTQPNTTFLSANLDPNAYSRKEEFQKRILPYRIIPVGGAQVAIIGVSTYEKIYDVMFKPVRILDPVTVVNGLASDLKKKGLADLVIVISHNAIPLNQKILTRAKDVDLLIGAHDHVKLTHPVVVKHLDGKTQWIVETGRWGEYLGRVDLSVKLKSPGNKSVQLQKYQLVQIDSRFPEDPDIVASIEELESRIEHHYGPVFHQQIAESEAEFVREGNAGIGSLITDAYLKFKPEADFALEGNEFIYDGIHRGAIFTSDVFNSIPNIYNPKTGKTWTLRSFPIHGRKLKWVLYIFYCSGKIINFAGLSASGLEISYRPVFQASSGPTIFF